MEHTVDPGPSKVPSFLRREILEKGIRQAFPVQTEILREGQYVRAVPFVLTGLIKVYAKFEERDLLLYYIQPEESCIMSFTAIVENMPSQVFAVAETATEAVLIPNSLVEDWIGRYPAFNRFYFHQYRQRYVDLLGTIQDLLFARMDQRLKAYLLEKARLMKTRRLHIHHREIAEDLGSAREVISRLMKKLEQEGVVRQAEQGWIEVLGE
ncbi:MAG: Crp/Fnr family transcriptional regulator [Phaeodactylibacter sp.]|nr:Crp/Fnr family transcriptional regulator [Phaeodactylibacter sp.]MCB9050858.1 Crp/Fnr family transcriptional regulator [Lewinellaceae bacterium]